MTQVDPIAAAYARSLIELAAESGSLESIDRELSDLADVLRDNPTFAQYLADPSVSKEKRAATIRNVLHGRVSPLLFSTVGVMNLKDRAGHLASLAHAYHALLEERQGKIDVDVTVAAQLDAAGLEEVRALVSKALDKNAVVRQKVDPEIIGGLVLKVGDKLIDGSVKTQLTQMRRKLLATSK